MEVIAAQFLILICLLTCHVVPSSTSDVSADSSGKAVICTTCCVQSVGLNLVCSFCAEQPAPSLSGVHDHSVAIADELALATRDSPPPAVPHTSQCAALMETIRAGGQQHHEEIVEMGVKAMQSVCLIAANLSAVDSVGGFEVLLFVMQSYPTHALITGCQIIQRITVQDNGQFGNNCATNGTVLCCLSRNMINRFILALITAMNTCCMENATLTEQAFIVLPHLSMNPDNEEFIIDLGGIPAVIALLRRYADNAAIVFSGCDVLQSLILDVVPSSNEIALGCIPLMYSALRVHASNADVVFRACYALIHLSKSEQAAACIVETDGVELIVSTMMAHKNSVIVQHICCAALDMLAFDDGSHARIVQSGAVAMIVADMEAHANYLEISVHGCAFFASISKYNIGSVSIIDSGGVAIVINAMKEHFKDTAVLLPASAALFNLACDDGGATHIILSCGIQAVIAALEGHSDFVIVVEAGCRVLARLSSSNENLNAVVDAKGIPALLSAMGRHSSSANVISCGCDVFDRFCSTADAHARLALFVIAGRHVPITIICALRTHQTNGKFVRRALFVLDMLFKSKITFQHRAKHAEAFLIGIGAVELFQEMDELDSYEGDIVAIAKVMIDSHQSCKPSTPCHAAPHPLHSSWRNVIMQLCGLSVVYHCLSAAFINADARAVLYDLLCLVLESALLFLFLFLFLFCIYLVLMFVMLYIMMQ